MKSIIRLLSYALLFMLSLLFISCGVLTKTKTITETITITKLDTIIIIQKDTSTVVKFYDPTTQYSDTISLENKTAKVRSYYNPIKRKIVLELTGKTFNVPVSFNQIVKTKINNNEIIKNKKIGFHYYIFFVMILIFLYAYLTRKK